MIRCCYGCVAPKRHPGCHSKCPEYLAEKKAHDEAREKARKSIDVSVSICGEYYHGIERAAKRRRKRYGKQHEM